MRRRGGVVLLVLLALGGLIGLLLSSRRLAAGGSSLARGGAGWLAARLYLARRGPAPELVERPLAAAANGVGTLVIVFPWQSRTYDVGVDVGADVDDQAVLAHLGRGGDVLLAYGLEPIAAPAERSLLGAVGAEADVEALPRLPLVPWRWRREMTRGWKLRRAPRWVEASAVAPSSPASAETLQLRRPRWLPLLAPEHALLVGPKGEVVAAAFPVRRGRVVVLPAELLCNARLSDAAHAALLESLRGWLRGPWRFDEYHHGFGQDGEEAVPSTTRRGFDLLFAQLVLIYGMAALALARRLGPAWREPAPLVGSAGAFLLRLGSLHHELGHHVAGALLLLRRAAELDRRLVVGPGLQDLARRGDAGALVEVGQAVARSQRHS